MIQSIRDRQPAYNLITNNCQTYALQLLDAIKASGEMEFATTLAIYDTLLGPGKVKDLFADPGPGPAPLQLEAGPSFAPPARADTVVFAQEVMDTNTAKLDTGEQLKKQKKKKGILSVFKKKGCPVGGRGVCRIVLVDETA